ncbi:hypothetical protein [Microbacterium sp. A93]|uniref:hypothetical protein n=1 Tax=Microbacterium sp. A93 TaxID=3450716 RepID=UPI003F4412E0
MAAHASSPLSIVFVAPPESGARASHGLIGGDRFLTDLLRAEVAACVAAVGHRLHVVPRSEGWSEQAVTAAAVPPALILWGLAPEEDAAPDTLPGALPDSWADYWPNAWPDTWPDAPPRDPDRPVIPVTLGGSAVPHGALGLPAESRQLCRALARAVPAGTGPTSPHRAAVLVHQGDGPDGDARWPGLSWALTMLGAGPGRGVLVDVQGPGGSLSARLRAFEPPASGRLGWQSTGAVPVPGPALMGRLPGAGGVRWWGWAAPGDGPVPSEPPETHGSLWAEREACVQVAHESSPWTVMDAGRDLDQARAAAARGTPVVLCTDRPLPPGLEVRPDVVLQTAGAAGTLPFRPADWAGTSMAAWGRSARRGSGRRLAAEIGLRLEQGTGSGTGGVLAGRSHS